MPGYTNIPKPTGSSYINVNSSGKESFDDDGVTFDSANTFFDGINNAVWSNLNKPNFSNPTTIFVDINDSDWNGGGGLANPAGTYATIPYTSSMATYVGLYIVHSTSTIPSVVLGVLDRMAVLSNGALSSQEQIGLNNGKIRTPQFSNYTNISKPT